MVYLALFFLGLVQGLTEFLPVSSSGHLVLFSKVFGIEESLFVSIILHVATLVSVIIVLHKEIWQIIKHPLSTKSLQLVLSTLVTGMIVLLFMPIMKRSFSGSALPLCFALSAVFLFCSDLSRKEKFEKPFSYKTAFFMGLAQGFAVFPGISRSGTTIGAGILCKNDREEVAKFSFLMSLPIIVLSLCMEIFEITTQTQPILVPIGGMVLSFFTAMIVGVFAIKFMLKFTSKSSLKWFSIYLIILSVISLFLL